MIDIGAAPGSWSQFIWQRFPSTTSLSLVACDLLPLQFSPSSTKSNNQFHFFQGDFTSKSIQESMHETIEGDVISIVSDMAPNVSGIADLDHGRSIALNKAVSQFAVSMFQRYPSVHVQHLLIKVLDGPDTQAWIKKDIEPHFKLVKCIKPDASRSSSREMFVYAQSFKL
eukprot:CAMPEP_0117422434 /NCGR_PEP_ID=MMETSP0758-20121206/3276_1 /TAXON_ID=63605 /ORGANISM="Percolomonas cosmopolitus, Strain AE-1 (ATCC 50343)" /LENGTH=169 /DNA_ID=CAMNT_0005205055 /DNA_START=280 /DNA_END=786 /DNA_ORIENTATION=-